MLEVAGVLVGIASVLVAILALFGIFGLTVYVVDWFDKRRKAKRDVTAEAEVEAVDPNVDQNTYGHQFKPVPELFKRLPKQPYPHMWEVRVDYNAEAEPVLTLSLLNNNDPEAPVPQRTLNLVRDNIPGGLRSWAQAYHRFSYIYDADNFASMLLGPLRKWADKLIITQTASSRSTISVSSGERDLKPES